MRSGRAAAGRPRPWAVVALVVALASLVPSVAATAQTTTTAARQPTDFGPLPYHGDCRDAGGQVCVQDPWTGNLSVSPKVIREGETVTATFSLEPGGVSFTMPNGGKGCRATTEVQPREVQNDQGRWELKDEEVPVSSTCTFKPGPTGGRWTTFQVGVTGPCGSQIAVQEGRAEFAACAGTYASDYYGVIAKDDDRYGISGHVQMSDGRGMAGVPITLSGGPTSGRVVTDGAGDYYFIVKKGTYTVSAGARVCATPRAPGASCSPRATVSVPSSQTVNFEPPGEGIIKGLVFGEDSKPKQGVTIHVVGPDGTTVTSDDKGKYEARVPEGHYTLSASQPVDVQPPPGQQGPMPPRIDTYCADDNGTFPSGCRDAVAVDVKPDRVVNWKIKPDPDAIEIELTGKELTKGESIEVTLKATNPRDVAIKDIQWANGTGLGIDTILQYAAPPLVAKSGPTPALPTRLEAKASATATYQVDTPEPGQAVVVANVKGTYEDGKATKGTNALTVTAGKPVDDSDFADLAVDGVDDALAQAADYQDKIDKLMAQYARNQLTPGTPQQQTMAEQLGLPADLGGLFKQNVDEARAFWQGWGEGFSSRVDELGQSGGKFLADTYATLEDPVSRRELAERVVASAKELPGKTLENLGYLGQAYLAAHTPEGLKTVIDANSKLAGDVAEGLGQAYQGYKELIPQAIRDYEKDPVGYNRSLGKTWGGASADGAKEAMFAVLTETGLRGAVTLAPKMLEGAGLVRSSERVVGGTKTATAGAETLAGADEAAAMSRRLDLAEQASRTFQELDYGTVLDDTTLLTKGGMRAEDAREIQSIARDVKTKFGVDLQIGARTSEPLSAGIDGVAKREFIKPKAISTLDKLLGGEESLTGRASVFEPKMPPPEVLKGLEARSPGITSKLQARYADQAKLWKEFQDENSSLRTIVEGSTKSKDGITVVVERPGYTLAKDAPELAAKVPGQRPFAYLEQLDDPAFLEARGISEPRAAELKQTLSRYPDNGHTRLLVEEKNGTTTFIEGLQNKPIISDLDLEFAEPVGGWPPGKRGQIETYVNARMKQVERFPQHGWSDAAIDVPADYAEVAAKFRLTTANPAAARGVAEQYERRFKTMARLLRDKAAKAVSPEVRRALLDKAAKFDALTADELLKKYPPGEKVIVITAGDIRVGSSTPAKP